MHPKDSFHCRRVLSHGGQDYHYMDLQQLYRHFETASSLPFSFKILLENLLRTENGMTVTAKDIEALARWDETKPSETEIAFTPARVILQDFTGVPAIVDLAAMRDAMQRLGGDPKAINPLSPVELVIDHSVMVDYFGNQEAAEKNAALEFQRNRERYAFLRWGQKAFDNFKVVPPATGIVHQVNLEYLARVVFKNDEHWLYPDTLVGTDSHTTMINGLGILGWGVGGIEAEAALLGQPVTMLIPEVVGVELKGQLKEGTTATDLVLTITERLRKHQVVGKFVEFFGSGLDHLPIADRATIANMAPEYGATCGLFPIDEETLNYLHLTGRDAQHIDLIRAYAKAQGLYREGQEMQAARYSSRLTVHLDEIDPSIAGPKRPQDRIPLTETAKAFKTLQEAHHHPNAVDPKTQLRHGSVVIAAITSCTNTSNPEVMIAAGLIARKARSLGLKTAPQVKTSFAPGSPVVTDYLQKTGLLADLEYLGFYLVGYGCTTCIGNSGPLPVDVQEAITKQELSTAAVLSGNRNFEGRIHPLVKWAYLASPPLVVAYALAGHIGLDWATEPVGHDQAGAPIFLKDLWPSRKEIREHIAKHLGPELFKSRYSAVFEGDTNWRSIPTREGRLFDWEPSSTYIKRPPYFEHMSLKEEPISSIEGARALAYLGDSVTTDHISPAGDIDSTGPAAQYLLSSGIEKPDFNSFGSRRGNHEVMMRGTFANIRLKNKLAQGREGGFTYHFPSRSIMPIFDAALLYQQDKIPLIVLAGKEYGTGSSRDWAAKGPRLLGVRAVLAESFERIHRSNLIGMGVLPLQFLDGESTHTWGLTGEEAFNLSLEQLTPRAVLTLEAVDPKKGPKRFSVLARIDTPKELEYYQNGGILHYVLRQLATTPKR